MFKVPVASLAFVVLEARFAAETSIAHERESLDGFEVKNLF